MIYLLILFSSLLLGCGDQVTSTQEDETEILSSEELKISSSSEDESIDVSSMVDPIISSNAISSSSQIYVLSSSTEISSSIDVSSSQDEQTFVDERDGTEYKMVTIGNQTWMAENLNFGTFVTDINDSTQFLDENQKFCFLNELVQCDVRGGLYQWHSALNVSQDCSSGNISCADSIEANHQGICPSGWHDPTLSEWNTLNSFVGGESLAGRKLRLESFNGTNDYGFNILSSGRRDKGGNFYLGSTEAYFWLASENGAYNARYGWTSSDETSTKWFHSSKKNGMSVRCLKN